MAGEKGKKTRNDAPRREPTSDKGLFGYILGLYRDNGKENGNCRNYGHYIGFYWDYRGYIGVI